MANETVGDNGTIAYKVGGTFTALAAVWDITPNKISVKQVETTKLASAADESQAGTPDYGEVSVVISTTAANTTLINGWIAGKATNTFKVTIDDETGTSAVDTAESFDAWVKEFEPIGGEIKKNEPVKSKLTLKITGVATVAPGSAGS